MSVVLYHHPFSRASTVLWMLEETGVAHELKYVDIMTGAHKQPEMVALNAMGKLPTLTDGDTVVTETAAIGLYLADRYSYGKLAPTHDDPQRGTYLRCLHRRSLSQDRWRACLVGNSNLAKQDGVTTHP
jgi:glutathione S-transferase